MRLIADRSRGLGLFAVTLTVLALLVPAATFGAGDIPEIHSAKSDFDARTATVPPSAAQLSAVDALGAEARWNRFGTPSSLIDHDGLLATGLAAPWPRPPLEAGSLRTARSSATPPVLRS